MRATPSSQVLVPAAVAALDDLAVFLARAERASPAGAARLQVLGAAGAPVLAVSVAPLVTGTAEDAGMPVVVGMRVLPLAGVDGGSGVGLDATVALRALLDRLAHARATLPLPPERVLGAAWAGVSAPRGGWHPCGQVSVDRLRAVAADGARHVAAGRARASVWSRALPDGDGLPAGAALVSEVLGFLGVGAGADGGAPPAAVARSGPWWRLTTAGGHVLARRPSLLG